jgi:hypothetical protein
MSRTAPFLMLGLAMLFAGGCKVVGGAGIPPYFECSTSSECDLGLGCFNISTDGASRNMCTTSCSTASDCPSDVMAGGRGDCISFDGGGSFTCFHACATSGDCPTGFACKSRLADGTTFPPICLPM